MRKVRTLRSAVSRMQRSTPQHEREEGIGNEEEDANGASHMQVKCLEVDYDSSDSDESYIVNFSYTGFHQQRVIPVQMLSDEETKVCKRDKRSLLIDTGSTFSCVNNEEMVVNLRDSLNPITAVSNGGTMKSTKEGDMPGWFTVYVNSESLMNILAMSDVRKRLRVTMNTDVEDAIFVHVAKDKVLKFKELRSGLYVWSPESNILNVNKKQVSPYSFLTLVEANKSSFTRRELERADDVKRLFINIGMPGYKTFFRMLKRNEIRDCPLTTDDAKRCLHIYEPEIAKLKGCTARQRPRQIGSFVPVPMPKTLIERHSSDHVSMDFLYVQSISFHHSITKS